MFIPPSPDVHTSGKGAAGPVSQFLPPPPPQFHVGQMPARGQLQAPIANVDGQGGGELQQAKPRMRAPGSFGSMFSMLAKTVAEAAAPPPPPSDSSVGPERSWQGPGSDKPAGMEEEGDERQPDEGGLMGRLIRTVVESAAPSPTGASDGSAVTVPERTSLDTSGKPPSPSGPIHNCEAEAQGGVDNGSVVYGAPQALPPRLPEPVAPRRASEAVHLQEDSGEEAEGSGRSLLGRLATRMAAAAVSPPPSASTIRKEEAPTRHFDSSSWLDDLVAANFGPGATTGGDDKLPGVREEGQTNSTRAGVLATPSDAPKGELQRLPVPKPGSLASRYAMLSDSYISKPPAPAKPPSPPPAPSGSAVPPRSGPVWKPPKPQADTDVPQGALRPEEPTVGPEGPTSLQLSGWVSRETVNAPKGSSSQRSQHDGFKFPPLPLGPPSTNSLESPIPPAANGQANDVTFRRPPAAPRSTGRENDAHLREAQPEAGPQNILLPPPPPPLHVDSNGYGPPPRKPPSFSSRPMSFSSAPSSIKSPDTSGSKAALADAPHGAAEHELHLRQMAVEATKGGLSFPPWMRSGDSGPASISSVALEDRRLQVNPPSGPPSVPGGDEVAGPRAEARVRQEEPTIPSPPTSTGSERRRSRHGLVMENSGSQFKELQQHIDNLTQEKYELLRGIEQQSKLASTLAGENESLASDYNQMAKVVEDLRKQVAKYEAEIEAQLLALEGLRRERDGSRSGAMESNERAKALAQEVVSLEEQLLKLQSQQLKATREMERAKDTQAAAERKASSLLKERQSIRQELEAMKEERLQLAVKLRRATVAAELQADSPRLRPAKQEPPGADAATQTSRELPRQDQSPAPPTGPSFEIEGGSGSPFAPPPSLTEAATQTSIPDLEGPLSERTLSRVLTDPGA